MSSGGEFFIRNENKKYSGLTGVRNIGMANAFIPVLTCCIQKHVAWRVRAIRDRNEVVACHKRMATAGLEIAKAHPGDDPQFDEARQCLAGRVPWTGDRPAKEAVITNPPPSGSRG